MSVTLLLPVAAATLRKRWLGFAGSFMALALGVAPITARGLLVRRLGILFAACGPSLAGAGAGWGPPSVRSTSSRTEEERAGPGSFTGRTNVLS
ncbi:hypothetical protein [Streptomyces sp. NPDC001568]|uniref:hypothetical protein n=1 Tax=Streptomyces sp. NPDC001568 TaxID=3364588 RepID=UPI0036BA1A54